MRIAEINMCADGSTGKIMLRIGEAARAAGHEVTTWSTHLFQVRYQPLPPAPTGHIYYGSYVESAIHYVLGQGGFHGCFSAFATWRLLRRLEKQGIDVLHLHNLHGFCINLPLLFRYIKKKNIRVVWTLHDCWAFTGHCPHFDMVGCGKWKNQCFRCPQYSAYPKSRVDHSRFLYRRKREWFTGVKNLTLAAPSQWLADLTRESFLKEYPVRVIRNGVDLSVFQPTESDLREQYGCRDKIVLLGVASGWSGRKGLDVFLELACRLGREYQIILVGTDDKVDKLLPENIISIHRTQNQRELARLYSMADLFVNPTREDTYPTVNMEALACGTPVVTFRTGGSPESLDHTCGSVVDKEDVDGLYQEIVRITSQRPFSRENCLERAKSLDENACMQQYLELYESMLKQGS